MKPSAVKSFWTPSFFGYEYCVSLKKADDINIVHEYVDDLIKMRLEIIDWFPYRGQKADDQRYQVGLYYDGLFYSGSGATLEKAFNALEKRVVEEKQKFVDKVAWFNDRINSYKLIGLAP